MSNGCPPPPPRQEAFMTPGTQISHAEFARVLRRAGYPPEVIEEIAAQLADPIDVDRDAPILDHYNLSRGRLMEVMGASP
ncbi:MAG TPA: hypothetical protein VHR40_03065 [Thermoleophilaceae bacterium]|jgi:hypothetical protein|nr:hypothetical protein [Thermoleophilaceae bacterium]